MAFQMLGLAPILADIGALGVILAVIGTGGLSALVTAVVAFKRMRVQNIVDIATVAKTEAEAAIKAQGAHIDRLESHIARQAAEIGQLRDGLAKCQEECRELRVEVRKRDES